MGSRRVKFFYCINAASEDLRIKLQEDVSDFINKLNYEGDNFIDIKTSMNTEAELFITVIYENKYDMPVCIVPRGLENE